MKKNIEKLSIDELIAVKQSHTLLKFSIAAQLSEIKKQSKRANGQPFKTDDPDLLEQYHSLKQEYNEVEINIAEIKSLILKASKRDESNLFKTIVQESFPVDVYVAIANECKRRREGLTPNKISFNFTGLQNAKTDIENIKKLTLKYFNIITDSREALNDYIDQNIPENNKSDFHRKVLKLNQTIPTLASMNLDRRKNNF